MCRRLCCSYLHLRTRPVDLTDKILIQLDGSDLCQVAQVSRLWYTLSQNERLWQNAIVRNEREDEGTVADNTAMCMCLTMLCL